MIARYRLRIVSTLAVVAGALAVSPTAPTHAQEDKSADDPVFTAMQAEMDRAKTLRMDDIADVPYHLQCFVTDTQSFTVSANLGALISRGGGKSGALSAEVRVGTPELDNTNFSSWSFKVLRIHSYHLFIRRPSSLPRYILIALLLYIRECTNAT